MTTAGGTVGARSPRPWGLAATYDLGRRGVTTCYWGWRRGGETRPLLMVYFGTQTCSLHFGLDLIMELTCH
jgi:hypothetical protein